jgi:hypothetical protein
MPRLVRPLYQDALRRTCQDLLEVFNLLRRGAEPGKMPGGKRDAAQIFLQLLLEASFHKDFIV